MSCEHKIPSETFTELLEDKEPQALAWIRGGTAAPYLSGLVSFFETYYGGVLIEAEMFGLPDAGTEDGACFCTVCIPAEENAADDGLSASREHGDPDGARRPCHALGMLPLISYQGYAWLSLYDKRLTLPEIIGKPMYVHLLCNDPASRPAAGDSPAVNGQPAGRGVIRRTDDEKTIRFRDMKKTALQRPSSLETTGLEPATPCV